MQTLLAYALNPGHSIDVKARFARVEAHYHGLYADPVTRSADHTDRLGLHIWDGTETPWRWPAFAHADGLSVATTYLPIGYERVVGDRAPETAAVPLARALAANPCAVLELTAPFVIASLDHEQDVLRLQTDSIGLGRLFEARFPGGWVWSNRPVAAALFAGLELLLDRDGWRSIAAAGWFLGNNSPLAGVTAVPSAATVGYDAGLNRRLRSKIDSLAVLSAATDDALSERSVSAVAEGLTGLVRSVGRMTTGPITSDLSGGRDSRLVTAACVAAGVEVTVNTSGAETGEADTAEALVAALPAAQASRITHNVTRPAADGPALVRGLPMDAPLLPNVLAWHRGQEGLRPPSYVPFAAPAHLVGAAGPILGGGSGEIAHGHFYPASYEELATLPDGVRLDWAVQHLSPQVITKAGPSAAARATVSAALRSTLRAAFASGLDDACVFDHFYAAERSRRWGTVADRTGNVTPLLLPEFIQAAFRLTPAQRADNALHRALTARLVPQWADIPYYQRPPDLTAPTLRPRITVAPDRDAIASLLADEDRWSDAFDVARIRALWQRMLDGVAVGGNERILQRVVWMATYHDFVASVNGTPTPPRPTAAWPPAIPQQRTPSLGNRGRKKVAAALRRTASTIAPS